MPRAEDLRALMAYQAKASTRYSTPIARRPWTSVS